MHHRAARALHLHIIPNSRVQLKPALVDKEFSFFFRSSGSVRVQAKKIPLGNQRTHCSLDLFLDSTEINSLVTLKNGIIQYHYFNVRYLVQTLFSLQELFVQVV